MYLYRYIFFLHFLLFIHFYFRAQILEAGGTALEAVTEAVSLCQQKKFITLRVKISQGHF